MRKMRVRRLSWLIACSALAFFGCNKQDSDRLARVAGKVADKLETATGGAGSGLINGWEAVRGDLDQMSLDTRVSARMRWDKKLAGAQIQIEVHEGLVMLRGVVQDLIQRRRAVDIAESTVGVERVNDELEVPHKEP